jgi:hypothetical protein
MNVELTAILFVLLAYHLVRFLHEEEARQRGEDELVLGRDVRHAPAGSRSSGRRTGPGSSASR